MAPPLYSIVDWNKHFENSRSRAYEHLHWIPIPNRHDGGGFSALACQPDASDLLAGWILIVQVASKMPVRGVLADKNGPLTADDLSVRTRFKAKIFTRCFEFLTNPKVRWLLCEQSAVSALSANNQDSISLVPLNRTEQNGIEQNGNEDNIAPRSTERNAVPDDLFLTYPCNGSPNVYHLTMAQVNEWSMLYQGLDVASECKKALAWIQANNKKTAKGMPKFLVGWLGRANNSNRAPIQKESTRYADNAWAMIVKLLHGGKLANGETIDTPEIQSAINAIGGSKYLSSLDANQLPYVKKDFIAAYNQASKQ